ncbi:MAG: o-succinylbenzoate synthase [Arcanobacterium sp.]|nr:o-succinylbenzoate synthase [Arcanobacterium sp.]
MSEYYLAPNLAELKTADLNLQVYPFSLPMRVKFRGITVRNGVLITDGIAWVECSPFADYDVPFASRWLLGALDELWAGRPEMVRSEVPINATIPAVPAVKAQEFAVQVPSGTAKVKVAEPGQNTTEDLARLAAVREVLGAQGKIRIDVNGKWSLEEALEKLPKYNLAAGGLEYAEQPVLDTQDLAILRRKVSVPIAADESIRLAHNPFIVKTLAAADIAVIKNQPIGGIRAGLSLAAELELPVVASSALESSIGLSSGVAMAAAFPELNYACGLGTATMFFHDVVSRPLQANNGVLVPKTMMPDFSRRGDIDADTGALVGMVAANDDVDAAKLSNNAGSSSEIRKIMQRFSDLWDYLQSRQLISSAAKYSWGGKLG